MRFRPALITDLSALTEIEQQQPRCAQWGESGWRTELAGKSSYVFCAEENSCVIGFIALRLVLESGEILNVGVHPMALRRGVGENLLNYVLEFARAKGGKQLTLEVASSNLPAVQLYQKAGFVQVGVRKKFYANNEDALLMERAL